MAWVVSKIIGDGLTPQTAFRSAVLTYGLRILNADYLSIDPVTGKPKNAFHLVQIYDADAPKLAGEAGCYVIPAVPDLTLAGRVALRLRMVAQGCPVTFTGEKTLADVVATIKAARAA